MRPSYETRIAGWCLTCRQRGWCCCTWLADVARRNEARAGLLRSSEWVKADRCFGIKGAS